MKILFLVFHGFSEHSGISKKIHYQVKGLRENGHDVRLCHYSFSPQGHRCRYIDETLLKDYGTGLLAALRQRTDYSCLLDYCVNEGIEMVYARSFQNANPWLISFFSRLRKAGIKAVTEIPTYPYDHEFDTFPWNIKLKLRIDKLFRHKLAREMNAIVTFSDADCIFGQRTIRISNGVDFDSIPIHQPQPAADGSIHLIGVAEVHLWHGYDRLIAGIGEYYKHAANPKDVFFHIVGGVHPHDMEEGTAYYPAFREIIKQYQIEKRIIFHGTLFGQELDEVFNKCQFAIGSLARHRSGITVIKTLKNREYATRGLPFIYSEQDSDFDQQPYVIKAPASEAPIDVEEIIKFLDTFKMTPSEIRQTASRLSWKIQMEQVVKEVFKQN